MEIATTTTAPHIVIIPSPGMGHLIPLVEFATKLHHHHRITTTFIIPTTGPPSKAQSTFLSTLPAAIDHLLLPPVNFDDLPPDSRIETRISLSVTRSLPSIHDAVKTLLQTKKIAAFVVDLFATDGFDVAREFHIPPYIFFPTTATVLSLFLHLPELDETVSCEYRELGEKIKIPGCVPIHGKDLLDPVQDRKNDAYKWVLHNTKKYKLAEGIVLNSFKDLEPGPIEALQQLGKPAVYPIGPLVKTGSQAGDSTLSNWLSDQPSGSVLYVSFGSGGTLTHDQIIELALGLEKSDQRFLWVIRCPNDKSANGTYFSIQNAGDPLAYLPDGFLERTAKRGLVVPFWAPQAQILAHGSTGGFLTHCGWNSILESIVNGVPMIAWPLFAEQKMNAIMLHEDVRVAMRVEANGVVGRDEIAKLVKGLMEGEEGKGIRSRIRDLKNSADKAVGEHGESRKCLDELAGKWI